MAELDPYVPPAQPPAWSRERLEGYFRLGVFLTLLLVGFLATMRAYMALDSAISMWFRPQWIPVAQAAFSIVLVAVVVWLLRAYVIARAR